MITWKIWRALKYPPRANRLFQLTIAAHNFSQSSFSPLALLIVLVLLPFSALTSRTVASMVSFVVLASLLIFIVLQIFTGSFYGLLWAVRTASTIAGLHRGKVYETLCLLPDGALGVSWIICTASLYWNGNDREFGSQYTWPIRIFFVFGIAVYFSPWLPDEQTWTLISVFINIFTITLWFRIEDVQSIVLACIIGMAIPTYTHHKIEVRIWTAAVYFFLQITAYALAGVVTFSILPLIYETITLRAWLQAVTKPIFGLTVIFLMRETMILGLWRWLLLRLEIRSQDNGSVSCIINRPA